MSKNILVSALLVLSIILMGNIGVSARYVSSNTASTELSVAHMEPKDKIEEVVLPDLGHIKLFKYNNKVIRPLEIHYNFSEPKTLKATMKDTKAFTDIFHRYSYEIDGVKSSEATADVDKSKMQYTFSIDLPEGEHTLILNYIFSVSANNSHIFENTCTTYITIGEERIDTGVFELELN
ncbi:MAG: hypothetical protein MJ146_03640 [Clostridia bacterium]|nr:hypothetical protein [Clostridia bacterium]